MLGKDVFYLTGFDDNGLLTERLVEQTYKTSAKEVGREKFIEMCCEFMLRKIPAGENVRRFNAPTIDEVAIVIVGDQFERKDIVLHRRKLVKIAGAHRCYDALQYPIIFLECAVRYHFNIKMINPISGEKTRNAAQ